MTYSLEDYLKNQPPPEPEPADDDLPNVKLKVKHAGGPVDQSDREWLKRLQNEPGYLIFLRLFQNIVQRYENSATLLSKTDPLGHKDELAAAWAYAGVARVIKEQLEREVAAEIAQL
jgi:hypothetical protein